MFDVIVAGGFDGFGENCQVTCEPPLTPMSAALSLARWRRGVGAAADTTRSPHGCERTVGVDLDQLVKMVTPSVLPLM